MGRLTNVQELRKSPKGEKQNEHKETGKLDTQSSKRQGRSISGRPGLTGEDVTEDGLIESDKELELRSRRGKINPDLYRTVETKYLQSIRYVSIISLKIN